MFARWGIFLALASLTVSAAAGEPAKLKVLYITGGNYHDYKALAPVLTEGIRKHANAECEVRWALGALDDSKLGEGFDAIIYNMCFDQPDNPAQIANVLRVTREGKPTVLIHCAMHTFRNGADSEEWTTCCGERTRKHDPYQAFGTWKADKDHPILKTFPDDWKTPGDELYQTIVFPAESHALLRAKSPKTGDEHVVCWVHKYGKARVFGTTLGHDMKTAGQDDYQRLLANGLLWACDKLGDDGQPREGYRPVKK